MIMLWKVRKEEYEYQLPRKITCITLKWLKVQIMSVDTLKSLLNKIKMNDFYSERANYIEQKEKDDSTYSNFLFSLIICLTYYTNILFNKLNKC